MKAGIYILIIFVVVTALYSCEKLVDVQAPTGSLSSGNIYADDATAASVLTGVYADMNKTPVLWGHTLSSISVVAGLSADELTLHGGASNANTTLAQFYQNNISAGQADISSPGLWKNNYSNIYIVNLAIERLTASTSLTPSVKNQLLGEAKFLRAFFYFYLTNLYGDVPLTTSSDYEVNNNLGRSPADQVYSQIINDLKEAIDLLDNNYKAADVKTNTPEKVRPNKSAAAALLARSYLYTGDWTNAELLSSDVINSGAYDMVSLKDVFLKNSQEAIWQLQPVVTGWNTEDARAFILPLTGPTASSPGEGYPIYMSTRLLTAFENSDQRRAEWIDSVNAGAATYFFPYKYKSAVINSPVTEYVMVLRLAEQYLIRAEARARQNNTEGARNDLNVVRRRAGLPDHTLDDKDALIDAILHERRLELFTEWGHRWLDLKRTNYVDVVMTEVAPAKGTAWNSSWALYPIPLYDLIQNPNLKQNKDY